MKSIIQFLYYFMVVIATLVTPIVLIWNPDWICHIYKDVSYVWYDGIWHGIWALAHLIRDVFTHTNCISHSGTTMYYVCFWGTVVFSSIIGVVRRILYMDSSSSNVTPSSQYSEERLQRLISTDMERRHNALAKRVSAWLCEIVSHPGFVDKSNNISNLITTQIMNFVFSEDEDKYPVDESKITELHNLISSTLIEHEIDCQDDEIDNLIEMSLLFIDESIKASQKLYNR